MAIIRRNPNWTGDELILACDLVAQNGWRQLDDSDPRVAELSKLLQSLPLHPRDNRLTTFRNQAGVARKTADIATAHPDYKGTPTNGSSLDRVVLDDFIMQPAEMHARAEAIRDAASRGELDALTVPTAEEDFTAHEGGLLMRRHAARERDPRLRKRKITEALGRGQPLSCEVCGFDFEHVYGERGRGYIECHHVVPLHTLGPRMNRLQDLALVCANCHRMVHRTPWLTPSELRAAVLAAHA